MRLELTQKMQQSQVLAPQMILSMDILLLAVADLEQRIDKEFAENPALELSENEAEEPLKETAPEKPESEGELFEKIDAFQEASQRDDFRPKQRATGMADDRLEMLQNTEGKPLGLKEQLMVQLHVSDFQDELQEIGEQIVNNLDHRGYLFSSAEDIFSSLGGEHAKSEFERALAAVRSLEPAGIAAEDLQQCLLLQLQRDRQDYPLETQIILNHLEDLRQNKIPKIAKDLEATVDEIKDAVEIIMALDPVPGTRYESSPTIYIRPDINVEKVDGKLEVRVEKGFLPQLKISESCRRVLKESRGNAEVAGFVRKKIESAQWLLQAVRQRQRTLYDIAVSLVEYQREFMEEGVHKLKALRMQTIADLVNVHISTISRAIKGKYMQTPYGVFEMRYFFTGGVGKADGELESRRNVYRHIGTIISQEDKARPLSDSHIAGILQKEGLSIARRTVTKYREQERIPSSRLRKTY
jgi:RNA polymerase sigma-54 factor